MRNNPYNFISWKDFIPNIEDVIEKMEKENICAVGVTPYSRVIPAFFLKNYSIFTLKSSEDFETLKEYVDVESLEQYDPRISENIHGTTDMVTTKFFRNFFERRNSPKIMFYTITQNMINFLNKRNILWMGNEPKTCEDVSIKSSFRNILKLALPLIPSHIFLKEDFFSKNFYFFENLCGGSFVVQRGDKEVSGLKGTYFIKQQEDFFSCVDDLKREEKFNEILISPYIEGYSCSMLGCVTSKGVLTGPLQIQFIDVKECLNNKKPSGCFFGNDLNFEVGDLGTQNQADFVVKKIGEYLGQKGYKGIFGIDFVFDKKTKNIFAIECNPRFTGSLNLYSLALLEAGLPPLEFFHMASHLNIEVDFDFQRVDKLLKIKPKFSQITFAPDKIYRMGLPLSSGIYYFNFDKKELFFKRKGISLFDIKNQDEFLLIDIVPKVGHSVEQGAPKFFRMIFPYSITVSSYEIERRSAFLVERFAKTLLEYSRR